MKYLLSFFISLSAYSRDYVIFSMNQDLYMGGDNQTIRKNYYVNIGEVQGVKKDTVLDVYRIISVLNPYSDRSRVNYRVKIGELKVIHTSENASITLVKSFVKPEETPIFELDQFMVGDHVAISVN